MLKTRVLQAGIALITAVMVVCTPFPVYKAKKTMSVSVGQVIYGTASYYGKKFQGKLTANGERFDMYKLTAAHRSLPFNTKLRVTNMRNNQQVVVRVNDRGPYAKGRILDLSFAAAREIGMIESGTARVKLEVISVAGKK